jgi:Regulator of polyketide synthase expression
MIDTYATLSPAARRALVAIAGHLEQSSDEIAGVMVVGYVREIPQYATITDEGLLADVHSVSSALVRCWLRMLRTGSPADPDLMDLIQDGARRRAAQGMDLSALLRAYRLGVRSMWTQMTESPDWRSSSSLRKSADRVTAWVLDYSDLLCTQVESCYLEEAHRVAQQREYRRSALLNAILTSSGESENRHSELSRPHVLAVVEVSTDRSLPRLEQLGHLLERSAGAMLWTVRHTSVVAAVPMTSVVHRNTLREQLEHIVSQDDSLTAGLGGSACSGRDSRSSYVEAIDAIRVGRAADTSPRRVYDYLELAPLVEMLRQPERARRFTAAVLEPFGLLTHRTWMLPTLEAYLVHNGRQREIADALSVHVSTVKYRLGEIRGSCPVQLEDGRQAGNLLLAIRLQQILAEEHDTSP